MNTELIRVLAAVIRLGNTVLLAQRPSAKRHGGLWEFPGGKLASGEDHLAAAKRELDEELGLKVESVGAVLFERQDPGSEFLIQFVEVRAGGEPEALESVGLLADVLDPRRGRMTAGKKTRGTGPSPGARVTGRLRVTSTPYIDG